MRLNPGLPVLTTPLSATSIYSVQHGQGTPVVLVHGSLCDYRYWTPQLRTLGAEHEVHSLSLRHCWPAPPGTQAPAHSYSIETHASDLVEWLQHRFAEPVHLVGHSRGARVALEAALSSPKLLRSLSLADLVLPADEPDPARGNLAIAAAEAIEQGQVEIGLGNFVDAVNGPNTWRRMIADFRQMALDNAHTLALQARETLQPLDSAAVAALPLPLLAIGGAMSPERYTVSRERLQQCRPDLQVSIIPAAAHGMNLARPQAFRDALRTFWSSLD